MEFELRFDRATIEPIQTEEGFLKARVRLSRPGVYPYFLPDGSIRKEAKLPDELFKKSVLDSLNGAPFTNEHPSIQEGGFVTSENYIQLMKGTISNPAVNDGFLEGELTVYDSKLIEEIKSRKKTEVSIGFKSVIDKTPGELNGERFDAVQRNIRVNHVALVKQGNAGPEVRIQLDSTTKFAVMKLERSESMPDPIEQKPDVRQDTVIVEEEPGWMKSFFEKLARMLGGSKEPVKQEPAIEPKADESAKLLQYEAMIAGLQKKLEEVEKSNVATLDRKITERTKLVEAARAIVPDLKHDGKSEANLYTFFSFHITSLSPKG